MERAKTEYKWRAYSPERAIEELDRLSRFTNLSHWVINLADPLFGFRRSWRRQVLEGIIKKGLLPLLSQGILFSHLGDVLCLIKFEVIQGYKSISCALLIKI